MTPRSNFMVVAPDAAGQTGPLKSLLETMTASRGHADSKNAIVPFGLFEEIHYARFVLIEDQTLDDLALFGKSVPVYPITLAFLVDCDGSTDDCLSNLVRASGDGLRQIFSHCEGFGPDSDLLAWMRNHFQPSAASYVNWIGRTVRQIREEAALRDRLLQYLRNHPTARDDLQGIRDELVASVRLDIQDGTLTL